MLKIDFWNILFTVINLLVLYFLLKKFLIKPVQEIMAKREALINEGLESARTAQAEADELKKEYAKRLETADEKSTEIIRQAKADASVVYDKKMTEADEKAEKVVENARRNMEIEREKMMRDIQPEIAGLVLTTTAKVIEGYAGEAQNLAVYDAFIAEESGCKEADSEEMAEMTSAELHYVTMPTEEQKKNLEEILCRKYHCRRAELKLVEEKELVSGFVLYADDRKYDWSIKGRIGQLEQNLIRR